STLSLHAALPISPRSSSSMNGSPAICAENRVHRAHWMHRSRSSRTWVESGTGLGKVRLVSVKRVSPCPVDIAWFCSGHSPPLSQTGQSSGRLISRNSMMPRCAFSATGEVSWVLTTMPSITVMVQEACGLGMPRPLLASRISTRHWRQAPTGSSSGWSQNRGIWIPSSSAARITRVPLGTLIWNPSMVTVTRSSGGTAGAPPDGVFVVTVTCSLPIRSRRHGRTGGPAAPCAGRGASRSGGTPPRAPRIGCSRRSSSGTSPHGRLGVVERAAPLLHVLDVFVPEVLDGRHHRAGRAVAEGAERAAQQVVADVQELLHVGLGALAVLQPVQHLDHPEVALPA